MKKQALKTCMAEFGEIICFVSAYRVAVNVSRNSIARRDVLKFTNILLDSLIGAQQACIAAIENDDQDSENSESIDNAARQFSDVVREMSAAFEKWAAEPVKIVVTPHSSNNSVVTQDCD